MRAAKLLNASAGIANSRKPEFGRGDKIARRITCFRRRVCATINGNVPTSWDGQ